ncbi:MAG: hypothetical protein SGPRY_013712 [Prymnesium sp.]
MERRLRARDLFELWADVASHGFSLPAIEFYRAESGEYGCFSNYYQHAPFEFEIPEWCGRAEIVESGRSAVHSIPFAEMAIMLCKAAVMGDFKSYDAIARAQTPSQARALGRGVGPWKQRRWDGVVCEVALQIIIRKFSSVPGLKEKLLSTGNSVIAEMTRNDKNWGTGVDMGRDAAFNPALWQGTNILGWALMIARENLVREQNENKSDRSSCSIATPHVPEKSPLTSCNSPCDNLAAPQ